MELTKKQEASIKRWMDKKTVYQIATETGLSVYRVKKAIKLFRAEASKEPEPPKPAPQPANLGKFAVYKDTVSMTEAQAQRGDEAMGTSPFSTSPPAKPSNQNEQYFARHAKSIHKIRPD